MPPRSRPSKAPLSFQGTPGPRACPASPRTLRVAHRWPGIGEGDDGAEHAVAIVGGGPTGLMLVVLALAGIEVVVLDTSHTSSRSGGLHARTIEVFDQRGIADRFRRRVRWCMFAAFSGIRLDISDFPTRHPRSRCGNARSEPSSPARRMGCTSAMMLQVTGFTQDDDGVAVELADGESLRAAYLVGCDGGRSLIRSTAGIEFPGSDPTESARPSDRGSSGWGSVETPSGYHASAGWRTRVGASGYRSARRGHHRTHAERSARSTHRRLRDGLWHPQPDLDLPVHRRDPTGRGLPRSGSCSPATPPTSTRRMRPGPPDRRAGCGEPRMEVAQVVRGTSPASETYHAERHPVGARVLHNAGRRSFAARTTARRRCATRCPAAPRHGRATQRHSRACCPASTSNTTSARDAPDARPRPRDRGRSAALLHDALTLVHFGSTPVAPHRSVG